MVLAVATVLVVILGQGAILGVHRVGIVARVLGPVLQRQLSLSGPRARYRNTRLLPEDASQCNTTLHRW